MDENFGGLIDMRKMKKALCAALCMSFIMAMPAYAAVTSTETLGSGDTKTTYVKTDNANMEYPCWIWKDGYCYYYENSGTIARNTTTRDGYTVDAEGRWTVNGVPQTNGYGSKVLGTAEYNGKSEDEIWSLMQGKIKGVFETGIANGESDMVVLNADGKKYNHYDVYTYTYSKDDIAFDYATFQYGIGDSSVFHNDERNGNYLTVSISGTWSDEIDNVTSAVSKAAYANRPLIKEQLIKATVGDTVGQELFNYLRSHADQKNTSGAWNIVYDASGNPIKGDIHYEPDGAGDFKRVFVENPNGLDIKYEWNNKATGDGFNASAIDWSAWQNRTTDYGKRFSVAADGHTLKINIFH